MSIVTRGRGLDLVLASSLGAVVSLACWLESTAAAVSLPGGEALPSFCWLRAATGFPCPFCGLTRAFVLTIHGDLGAAVRLHPAGPAFVLAALVAILTVGALAFTGRPALSGRPVFRKSLEALALTAIVVGLGRSFL